MAHSKKLHLPIETDVLTVGTAAEVVNALLDFLLYQRQQIPFPYKTYKYYVESWVSVDAESGGPDAVNEETKQATVQSYKIERQRELAKETKRSISDMRQLISRVFEQSKVRTLRFLFGATTFMPKEAYTIHIPNNQISRRHYSRNHTLCRSRLSKIFLSLVTHQELYQIFSHDLSPTKVYLEMELLDEDHNVEHIVPKEIGRLPKSCKDVHIHLSHVLPSDLDGQEGNLQCCQEWEVFEDFKSLNIVSPEDNQCSTGSSKAIKAADDEEGYWWEAEIQVRGFKEKSQEGRMIWSNK